MVIAMMVAMTLVIRMMVAMTVVMTMMEVNDYGDANDGLR